MGRKLEEFYHGGGDVLSRENVKSVEKIIENTKEKAEQGLKEKLQRQWLDPENPALWNEYDYDD